MLSNHDRLTREHRLYQADFLLRKYHFDADEMEFGPDGNFDLARDPKLRWAERHPEFFPVRINTADREALLRIPCIGPTYADRIIAERRKAKLSNLLRLGLRGKTPDRDRLYRLLLTRACAPRRERRIPPGNIFGESSHCDLKLCG